MSRRYRLEIEKSKQADQEVVEEEDKLKLQRERIYAPVIWQRLATGFRIEDLKDNRYDEVLEMFKVPEERVRCQTAPGFAFRTTTSKKKSSAATRK